MGTVARSPRAIIRNHGIAVRLFCAILLMLLPGTIYLFLVRPAQLRWGATDAELKLSLPGDDLVAHPAFDATRAITIRGRPEDVWPGVVQTGYGRAGFYGWDLIENPGGGRGLRSATSILPEFQHPRTGDNLPLSVAANLRFGLVDPPRTLVWVGREDPPRGVFVWALVPQDATHTRMISRILWRYGDDWSGRALGVFTELADHVAVRAILRGVRDRVEGREPQSLTLQAAQLTGWLLACAEFAVGFALVLRTQRWGRWWFVALGAALMLEFLLYGPAPAWVNAILPWAYLAGVIAVYRRLPRDAGLPQHHAPVTT